MTKPQPHPTEKKVKQHIFSKPVIFMNLPFTFLPRSSILNQSQASLPSTKNWKCIKIIQNQNSWNSHNPELSVEDPVRILTLCTLPRTICFTRKYTQTSYVGTLIVKHFDHTSIERKVALDRKPSRSSWKNGSDKSTYSYHQSNKIIDL